MGQKDIAEASFIELNDVFADIFNVLIYKGKRVIKEKELLSMPRKSQYKSDSDKLHEQERDVLKKWRGRDVELAILGVENQTLPDKDMPFRIINYDGVSYRSQIKKKSKKRYPVITIVLYFGENQEWNYLPHLTDCFNTKLPKDDALWEYISDYKINVFDIGALTGDERYSEIKEELCMKKGDDVSMCTVIDTFEKRGIKTGIERGIKKGAQQELTALVRDGIISKEIASQRLEMSLEEFEKLLATK